MDPELAQLDEGMQELMAAAEKQTPSRMNVSFSLDAMENPEKSKEKGRPVFDDVEIISIRAPGAIDIIRRPVRPEDKKVYAKEYVGWKTNQSQEVASGTPLSQWPPLKKSQELEARTVGILTVEQLSEVADVHLQRLGPGWLALRQKARDWLLAAKDGATLAKLRDELDEAQHRIATMEQMLAKQAAELQGKDATTTVNVAPVKDPEVAELKAMVTQLMMQKTITAEPPKVRRKPGRKSNAEKAALAAAQNGEQKG